MKKINTFFVSFCFFALFQSLSYAQGSSTILSAHQLSSPEALKTMLKNWQHEDLIQSPVDTVQAVGVAHRIVIRIGNQTIESQAFVVSHEFDPFNRNSDLPLASLEREHSHLVLSTED